MDRKKQVEVFLELCQQYSENTGADSIAKNIIFKITIMLTDSVKIDCFPPVLKTSHSLLAGVFPRVLGPFNFATCFTL